MGVASEALAWESKICGSIGIEVGMEIGTKEVRVCGLYIIKSPGGHCGQGTFQAIA